MSEQSDQKIIHEEITKEFKLERMILFSDAVFAIVITLMAIEIHLPESIHTLNVDELNSALIHLLPTIIAYVTSFFFIGAIWNQHLHLFGLLKSFDTGLVVRNLLLLFFVGLFPFAATVISRGPKNVIMPMMIYLSIIICTLSALTLIEDYIFIRKPELRNGSDISKHLEKFNQRKVSLMGFSVAIVMILITDHYVTDPRLSFLPTMWVMIVPVSFIILKKLNKRKNNKSTK
jgi:uncharacterized membrane protein